MTAIKGYEGLADYNRAGSGIRTQRSWEPRAMKVDDPRSVSSQSVRPASESTQAADRKVQPLASVSNELEGSAKA